MQLGETEALVTCVELRGEQVQKQFDHRRHQVVVLNMVAYLKEKTSVRRESSDVLPGVKER